MNEEVLSGLKSFDRVWSRVTGETKPTDAETPGKGEVEAIKEFIADEARDEAFYLALAERSGRAARTLRCIAGDEQNHKRALQLECFLLTGDCCAVAPSCPVVGPILESMRIAYANELKGAANYLAAAEATKSEQLRDLFRLHAADEKNHAEALRGLMFRVIC